MVENSQGASRCSRGAAANRRRFEERLSCSSSGAPQRTQKFPAGVGSPQVGQVSRGKILAQQEVRGGSGASMISTCLRLRGQMRLARHILVALLLLVAAAAGGLAFILYDPLSGGGRFLSVSQLITAPQGEAPLLTTGNELPVQDTDPPRIAALALRYQPTLIVSGLDRNWPTSVIALLGTRWHGRVACIYVRGRCRIKDPTARSFTGVGDRSDYIRFPTPVDDVQDTFLASAQAVGVPAAIARHWPFDLRAIGPFSSALIYFYYLARTRPNSYPGVPAGLISLEYWFFYPLNYFPTLRTPLQALRNPIGSTIGNSDYHQGDLEHVAVLLDPRTLRPRYLWMARHSDEGQLYRWHSRSVQWDGDHPTIYAALGSHASYARCGIQRRSRTYWFINDYVICIPHATYGFLWSRTPLVDLTHTVWGCWRGHLGEAGNGLSRGGFGWVPYETDGPFSPLNQAENFRIACRLPGNLPKPAPPL